MEVAHQRGIEPWSPAWKAKILTTTVEWDIHL